MSSPRCTDCDRQILLLPNPKGFKVPYDLDGTPHRQSCTGRAKHHKSKRVAQDSERRARTKR